ncbi:hypothetical protein TIFTF001_019270 [Ficus carica]|uniref:Uncharacterized protein n=1 Tax=Ficus carica TaxID=3494 RepID=A0AA88AST8_FICCA|nr:hypothetical protein TIFTF001_019270 [Ficus carica]
MSFIISRRASLLEKKKKRAWDDEEACFSRALGEAAEAETEGRGGANQNAEWKLKQLLFISAETKLKHCYASQSLCAFDTGTSSNGASDLPMASPLRFTGNSPNIRSL